MNKILSNLQNKLVAAPMAATTNIPFRKICKEFGASLTFSGMINSDTLSKDCTQTLRLAFFDETERPIALQLFGHNPDNMAASAKILETLKPDVIDINAGCPVQKINRLGAGAALLKDLNKLSIIVKAVVNAVKIPVSVKIRTGYTNKIVVQEAAKVIEDSGASFITVHARTRLTPYSEPSNWEWIKMAKKSVKIPVIGNGDIFYPQDAYRMLDETGCDLVLIARGALGNPWIFRDSLYYMKTKEIPPTITFEERRQLIIKHSEMSILEHGDLLALKEMKKHISWYTRGLPDSEYLRDLVFKSNNFETLLSNINFYFDNLENGIWQNDANPELEERKFREKVVFWLVEENINEMVGG